MEDDMTSRRKIVLCPNCLEELDFADIYYEPEERATGSPAYAETQCCGEQEVLIMYDEDDPEPDKVDIIKNSFGILTSELERLWI